MQREKIAQEIESAAKVVAYQTSPPYLYEEVVRVAIVCGVKLRRRNKNYRFVSMKRAAIDFVRNERRERKAVEEERIVKTPEEFLILINDLSIFYRATEGISKNKLLFLYHFVSAVIEDEDGPIALASKRCGFSGSYGSRILRELRKKVKDGDKKEKNKSGLREVRSVSDMQKLLHRRTRQRKT